MARMIRLTPMYSETVSVNDEVNIHEWKRAELPVHVNVESIVMISAVDDDEIGASVLIPDKEGHASLFVAETVLEVLDRVNDAQNWPTG